LEGKFIGDDETGANIKGKNNWAGFFKTLWQHTLPTIKTKGTGLVPTSCPKALKTIYQIIN